MTTKEAIDKISVDSFLKSIANRNIFRQISFIIVPMLIVLISLSLSSCAGYEYAGTNYVTVSKTADGQDWKIVGAKDEQNITFTVKNADGTEVTYNATASNSSAVLEQLVKQNQSLSDALIKTIDTLGSAAINKVQ